MLASESAHITDALGSFLDMQIPRAPPKTSESNPLGCCSRNLNFTFPQVKLKTSDVGTSASKPVPLSEGPTGARLGVVG